MRSYNLPVLSRYTYQPRAASHAKLFAQTLRPPGFKGRGPTSVLRPYVQPMAALQRTRFGPQFYVGEKFQFKDLRTGTEKT